MMTTEKQLRQMMSEQQERELIQWMMAREMEMANLSPELQAAIRKMRDDLVQGGTKSGAAAFRIEGTMTVMKDGKPVKLSAFETGFIVGRMYEKEKAE